MKKTFLMLTSVVVGLSLTLTNCNESDSTSVSKVSGKVTFDGGKLAAGAVIKISSEPNAAKVLTSTVADSSGTYTFVGIADGSYYISAKYNTENTNFKSAGPDITFVTGQDAQVSLKGSDLVQDLPLVSKVASGTDIVELGTGLYTLDMTHSRIAFEFAYDSVNATFNGHFATFGFTTLKFDEATPANSTIEAWIDITSTETGASTIVDSVNKKVYTNDTPGKLRQGGGRDGLNGCISHTFGVQYAAADTFFKGYFRPSSILSGGELIPSAKATFTSTSVAAYGDGYVAKGKLTFCKGVDIATDLYFHYIKGYSADKKNSTTGAIVKTQYSSFSGFFLMNALKDFGVNSGHVKGNPVSISTSIQVTKVLN